LLDIKSLDRDNDLMSTSVELPDALLSELKLRAEREGRKLSDVVADVLHAAMASSMAATESGRTVNKQLPKIKVRPFDRCNAKTLSQQEWCDWIKEQDLQSEIEQYEKAFGHQHVDRADS